MKKNVKKGLVGVFLACFAISNLVFSYSSNEDKQSSLSLRNLEALAFGSTEMTCDQSNDAVCTITNTFPDGSSQTGKSTGVLKSSSTW